MPQEIQAGAARAPLTDEPKDGGTKEEETTWMVKPPSRRTLNSRVTMARIGKRAGKASMMRIGKKSVEMLPDNPNLSLATFVRDERSGNMAKSWKTNFNRRWPNFISRFVRFYRTERGGSQIGGRIARRWSKGRSAFMRLGKRINDKVEEEPVLEMMSQKRDPEMILQKRDPEIIFQKGDPEIIFQKRDPEMILPKRYSDQDNQVDFGGSTHCLEENICNVVFSKNGMTYRIFYRHN